MPDAPDTRLDAWRRRLALTALDFDTFPSGLKAKCRTRPGGPHPGGGLRGEDRPPPGSEASRESDGRRSGRRDPGQPQRPALRAARRTALPYLERQETPDTPPHRGPVKGCSEGFVTFKCGCKTHTVSMRCAREDCVPCAAGPKDDIGREQKAKGYTARRRGRNAGRRILHNLSGRPLLHTVFTVPKELRGRAWDRDWWRGRLLALRRYLKKCWGLDWALASNHPHGDRDGPERFKPHLHLLWVRKPHVAGLSGFVDLEALRLLRWRWREILGWEGATTVVHHNYINPDGEAHDAQVQHRIQYLLRPFPGWSSWRGQSSRWWGKMKPTPVECAACGGWLDEEPDDDVCTICGQHVGATCPDCGEPLVYVSRLEPALDVDAEPRAPP